MATTGSDSPEIQVAGLMPGDHVCSFYTTVTEQLQLAATFIKTGLARGNRSIYAAHDRTVQEVRQGLQAAGIDVPSEEGRGALRVLTAADVYVDSGDFHPRHMLEFVKHQERQALDDGFAGVWFTGEMTWALGTGPGIDRLIEYEGLLEALQNRQKTVILCQYNVQRFGRPYIHDILHLHPAGMLHARIPILGEPASAAGEPEELYRFLMESTNAVVSLYGMDGRQVYICPSASRILGFVPETPFEHVHPEDQQATRDAWNHAVASKETLISYRLLEISGSVRWLEAEIKPVQFRGRSHVLTVTRDVTERKLSEQALRESERKLAEAQRIAHVGYWDVDIDADRVTWSDEIYRILGLQPRERITVAEFRKMIHPEDRARQAQVTANAMEGIGSYDLEYRVIRPDGEIRFLHSQGSITRNASGQPVHAFGIAQDITERKRAEETMRRSERVLRESENLGGTGSWEFIPSTREMFASDGYLRNCFGSQPQGRKQPEDFLAAVHPDDREAVLQQWKQLLAGGASRNFEYRVVWPDGTIHVLSNNASVGRDATGEAIRVYGTSQEITRRKRSDEALRRSEELLSRAEAIAHVASWTYTVDDRVLLKSEGACREFGWGPGPHRLGELIELVHPNDRPRFEASMQAALAGSPFEMEHRIVVAGQIRWILCRVEPEKDSGGRVVRLIGVSQDITARRELEQQFLQAQKMEALGLLAGGGPRFQQSAHDH